MLLIGKGLLLFLSFCGLTAAVRTAAGVNRFIAPAVTAGGIMGVLMIGGMTGVLLPVWIALYAAGFLGFIYAFVLKKAKPEWGLALLGAIYAALLAVRFFGTRLSYSDEFCEWGLAVRHLLLTDRFPNASTTYIEHQSYPLGASSFIYYAAKGITNSEGLFYIAQYFLQGLLYLPMFAVAEREEKKILFPFLTAAYVCMFHFSKRVNTIQVDILLAFFGIAIVTVMLFYREEPRKAVLLPIPLLIAVLFTKNSGLFFYIGAILYLLYLIARKKMHVKAAGLIALIAVPLAGFIAWEVYVKLAYTAGYASKHAISASGYLESIRDKGLINILKITKKFLQKLFLSDSAQVLMSLYAALCTVPILIFSARAGKIRKAVISLFTILIVYLVWMGTVWAMYIVSMPTDEALRAASIDRYRCTGQLFTIGLITVQMILSLPAPEKKNRPVFAGLTSAVCILAALLLAGYIIPLGTLTSEERYVFYRKDTACRSALQEMYGKDEYQLYGSYLVLTTIPDNGAELSEPTECFKVLYEILPRKMYVIFYDAGNESYDAGHDYSDLAPVSSITDCLAEQFAEAYDGFLILTSREETPEEVLDFLNADDSGLPVVFAE